MSGAAAVPAPLAAAEEHVYQEKAFGFWLYLMSDAIIFSLLFAWAGKSDGQWVRVNPPSTGKNLRPASFAEVGWSGKNRSK